MGKREAYLKILRKFTVSQKSAMTELEDALRRNDRATAVRIAHTLKGLAGNIGAEGLQEKAAALERVIGQNVPRKTVQTAVNETRSMLSFLIHELERALPAQAAAAMPAGPVSSAGELRGVLTTLRPMVLSRKPKKCAAALSEYRRCVWPEPLRENAAALETKVLKYQYQEALAILDSLMQALEGTL